MGSFSDKEPALMAADPPRNRGSRRSYLQGEALSEGPTLKT